MNQDGLDITESMWALLTHSSVDNESFTYPLKYLFLVRTKMKKGNKNPTIVHFEIPADDVERAKKFYSTLFGWKIEKPPGEMDYWMISTSGDSSDKSSLGGGMMKRKDPQQPNLNYIGVPSIDEYSKKVSELGGKVVMPKTEIPGYGFFAVCMDTEKNAFALWETIPQ